MAENKSVAEHLETADNGVEEAIARCGIPGGRVSGETEKREGVHTDVVAEVCAGENANAEVLLHLSDDLDCVIDGKMCLLRLSLALDCPDCFLRR